LQRNGEGKERMGREYKVKFPVPIGFDPTNLLRDLPGQKPDEIYSVAIESDGFYLVDWLVDRSVAAVALRVLLDEAISLADAAEVTEP